VKRIVWTALACVGCRSESVARTAPSASASAPEPVASASIEPVASAAPESGFEDQFLGDNFDAGANDPNRLTARPGYDAYANGRYGYTVDVPLSFVASPDPTKKDGRQWRLGHLAAMTVDAKRGPDLVLSCPHSPDVTAHKETETMCFATGKRDSAIFWEREALSRGTLYTLRIQYLETVKGTMEPIVAHINASWQF
jgi:hypothetical protein